MGIEPENREGGQISMGKIFPRYRNLSFLATENAKAVMRPCQLRLHPFGIFVRQYTKRVLNALNCKFFAPHSKIFSPSFDSLVYIAITVKFNSRK